MLAADLARLDASCRPLVPDDARRASFLSELLKLIEELVLSDALAKATIEHATDPSVLPPPGGMLQLGFVLYWAKHEPGIVQRLLEGHPDLQRAWRVLSEALLHLAEPTVTKAEYEAARAALEGPGLVGPDGQILGEGVFEGADPHWLYSLLNYVLNLVDPGSIAPFTPATGEPFVGALEGDLPVKIAVIGDWGTGPFDAHGYQPSVDVLKTVHALSPDYVVHLGDVYYSGTEDRVLPGEEQRRLVEAWRGMPAAKSFTLNSNHEMYGGAQGYFQVALGRDGSATPFSQQAGFSFFALTRGTWAFVGIDAAYHDRSSLYMQGGLSSDPADPQNVFLKRIGEEFENVVLLSHQTGTNLDGSRPGALVADVTRWIPRERIRLWYWGHVHLGIVYGPGPALGEIRGRCAGHSAIPIGDAWGLRHAPAVEWYAHRPVGARTYPNRVRNGLALLTLTDQGVEEAFYDAGDPATPAWSGSVPPA